MAYYCFGCQQRTSAGLPFCRVCLPIYADQLKSPWVKELKNHQQRETRADAQAQAYVVSLEALEELMLAQEERRAK